MTRKDFELIAAVVARERTNARTLPLKVAVKEARIAAVDGTAYALAHALATTNPLFDRSRFLRACGVPE